MDEIGEASSWFLDAKRTRNFSRGSDTVLRKSRNLPRKLSDQRGSQMFAPYCCPQTLEQPPILPRIRSNLTIARVEMTIFIELYNSIDIPILISNFGKTFRVHPSINPKRHGLLMDESVKTIFWWQRFGGKANYVWKRSLCSNLNLRLERARENTLIADDQVMHEID